jgi:hypothetical protein
MMNFLSDLLNLVTIPLAIYGGYTLLGLPYTDEITALGRKLGAWVISKFRA